MNKMRSLIGKTMNAYFDGKFHKSRLAKVTIEEVCEGISDFSRLTKSELSLWKKALARDIDNMSSQFISYGKGMKPKTFRFWDWNKCQFISGKIMIDGKIESILFARKYDGGFYGLDWNYELDLNS